MRKLSTMRKVDETPSHQGKISILELATLDGADMIRLTSEIAVLQEKNICVIYAIRV